MANGAPGQLMVHTKNNKLNHNLNQFMYVIYMNLQNMSELKLNSIQVFNSN